MAVSVKYYVEALGFRNADWGTDAFTFVNRVPSALTRRCSGAESACLLLITCRTM
jgi:hypothetical protein